jgi:hypothetical protein
MLSRVSAGATLTIDYSPFTKRTHSYGDSSGFTPDSLLMQYVKNAFSTETDCKINPIHLNEQNLLFT